ncbi:MAG: response regulator [Bacteroidota bacterium]
MNMMPVKKRILMLDDDFASHLYHKIMIEEAGYSEAEVETVECHAVDPAIEFLKERHKLAVCPQLILLDLNMPKKSGWDFLEAFKRIEFSSFIPRIIIVTNSENPAEIRRSKSYPEVIDYQTKYLSSDYFGNLLERADIFS